MARTDSPFVIGEYWLDKRRDSKAPDIWQIATYKPGSRSVVYRSTKRKDVDEAIDEIIAHHATERAKQPQRAEDAEVLPLLVNYWEEKGQHADSSTQIASSIRQFMGFLMQDDAGVQVTVAELKPRLFERFRKWRMKPHEYDVPWRGKRYAHSSPGVRGESVQRNLDDIRAGLFHQVNEDRLPYKPRVPSIEQRYRSEPRDRVLSNEEMGAIIGYCAYDIEMLRWVLLMVATACRPEAALAMDPATQNKSPGLIDLHPPAWARSKKRNPILPVIDPFKPWLAAWKVNPHPPATSRKRAWRTMRRALGLSNDVVAKTIRHTVATRLRALGVPSDQISDVLGHNAMKRTTRVYAKYDPTYLREAKAALTTVWDECCTAANQWLADHMLSTGPKGRKIIVAKSDGNARV